MDLVRRCPLRPIKTRKQHQESLNIMQELYENGPETLSEAAKDYLTVLSQIIYEYESKIYPPKPAKNSRQLIEALLSVNNYTVADLSREANIQRSNLSSFLHGKRALSKTSAQALAKRFSIPVEVFLQ
jgi:antitoxin component HigA of HigAB toxin-antitoxin module